jgi:protein-arginine deiminase
MTGRRKRLEPASFRAAASVLTVCALTGLFARGVIPDGRQAAQDRRQIGTLIPNIDDDDGDGRPDSGAPVLDPAVEDDLLSVLVKPEASLPEGAGLRVEVAEPWTRFVRIFRSDPAGKLLRPLQGRLRLSPGDAGPDGVRLAVEAGAFAGPGRPRDIDIVCRFETKDGLPLSRQILACAVAPFLMSSCLDPADAVHVTRTKLTERFANDLGPLVEAAGARLLSFENAALPEHDIWFQDATEIGYATDGVRTMQVALQGNRGRELDGLFAKAFLGRNSGVVHPGGFRGKSAEWIDWYGNLEVSPPLEVRDRSYPRGRVYAGRQGARAMHPEVIAFLEAQGAQTPVLWLDTSWLVIGHVDETVSWVPSKTGSAYRMLMPSPRLALEILRKAENDAPGCILNRGTKREDSVKGEFVDTPVAAALADAGLLADQEFAQGKIDGVRRTLQAELGVADADIIEIPVLFGTSPGRFAGRCDALTVNMVNSLLVGETLIVPDPHGPLVGGRDVLLQAVEDRLEPLGCKVAVIDDFYPYHRYGGEVHCGTNATRRPPASRR